MIGLASLQEPDYWTKKLFEDKRMFVSVLEGKITIHLVTERGNFKVELPESILEEMVLMYLFWRSRHISTEYELEVPQMDFTSSEDKMKRFLFVTAWGASWSLLGIACLTLDRIIPAYVGIPLSFVFLSLFLSSIILLSSSMRLKSLFTKLKHKLIPQIYIFSQ